MTHPNRATALAQIPAGEARLRAATQAHGQAAQPTPEQRLHLLVAIAWLAADYALVASLHTDTDPIRHASIRAATALYDRLTVDAGPDEQNVLNTAHAARRAHRHRIPAQRSTHR
jgi:hypothetical protein